MYRRLQFPPKTYKESSSKIYRPFLNKHNNNLLSK